MYFMSTRVKLQVQPWLSHKNFVSMANVPLVPWRVHTSESPMHACKQLRNYMYTFNLCLVSASLYHTLDPNTVDPNTVTMSIL